MNKLSILVTLILLQQALANQKDEGTTRNINNKTLLFSYICDDEKVKNIENNVKILVEDNKNLHHKLNLIVDENQNLRFKLDTFTSRINDQFTKLELAISKLATSTRQYESTNSIAACSCDQKMDVLKNISDSKSSQILDLKSILPLPTNCAEAVKRNEYKTGTYKINLTVSELEPFVVYCLVDPQQPEDPWTVIQRRKDGSVNFDRNWAEYQKGFGNLDGEFFIGLDILHALTNSTPHELWIQMEDLRKISGTANYSRFAIGDSSEAYALNTLGSFKGDASDSLSYHVGQKFTTKDVDNDMFLYNCAVESAGAWWYKHCYDSNLNGKYLRGNFVSERGIVWYHWRMAHFSLIYVHMAIRPVYNNKKF